LLVVDAEAIPVDDAASSADRFLQILGVKRCGADLAFGPFGFNRAGAVGVQILTFATAIYYFAAYTPFLVLERVQRKRNDRPAGRRFDVRAGVACAEPLHREQDTRGFRLIEACHQVFEIVKAVRAHGFGINVSSRDRIIDDKDIAPAAGNAARQGSRLSETTPTCGDGLVGRFDDFDVGENAPVEIAVDQAPEFGVKLYRQFQVVAEALYPQFGILPQEPSRPND
jgi:hypothetical protein